MGLDLEQLRTLVAFADTDSVKGASKVVHKTPSAVSTHLSKLSHAMGKPLFLRHGRRLILTNDGTELVRYARQMLATEREALAYFHGSEFHGTLRIGLPDDYIPIFMQPLLQTLTEVAPYTHLEVQCAPSAELRPMLARVELDLAILSAPAASLEGVLLRQEPVVWAACAQLNITDESAVPLALFPKGCILRRSALDHLNQSEWTYTISCVSRSMSAIQAAVRAGFAVSALTESCVPEGATDIGPDTGLPDLPPVDLVLVAPSTSDPTFTTELGDRLLTLLS